VVLFSRFLLSSPRQRRHTSKRARRHGRTAAASEMANPFKKHEDIWGAWEDLNGVQHNNCGYVGEQAGGAGVNADAEAMRAVRTTKDVTLDAQKQCRHRVAAFRDRIRVTPPAIAGPGGVDPGKLDELIAGWDEAFAAESVPAALPSAAVSAGAPAPTAANLADAFTAVGRGGIDDKLGTDVEFSSSSSSSARLGILTEGKPCPDVGQVLALRPYCVGLGLGLGLGRGRGRRRGRRRGRGRGRRRGQRVGPGRYFSSTPRHRCRFTQQMRV